MRQFMLALPAGGMLAGWLIAAAGCGNNQQYVNDARLDNGLVIILPGIEGESELNQNIRRGLAAGGIDRAMPIHAWGRPIPLAGVLINQVDVIGNRLAGIGVARVVQDYQDSHPGRPVFIVGHSGGGGVAVFAAEALPEKRQVDGLVLLSASISSTYDLSKALRRCRHGIVNFYNPDDAGLLGIGTTVVGTVDGMHGPSAGLNGFTRSRDKLFQIKLTGVDRSGDPHASTTRVGFVSSRVAPWLLAEKWPAGASYASEAEPTPPPPSTRTAPRRPDRPAGADDEDTPTVLAWRAVRRAK